MADSSMCVRSEPRLRRLDLLARAVAATYSRAICYYSDMY